MQFEYTKRLYYNLQQFEYTKRLYYNVKQYKYSIVEF